MTGKYEIRLENKRVIYQFTIRRNITIIRGNSATGKTTLIGMLQSYERDGEESGITLRCRKKCAVVTDVRWEENIKALHDSIIFIDEDYHFTRSQEFAGVIRHTDNYYVLITRDNLYNLPYSVDEIYGIHTSGKYSDLKKTYNEFYRIYSGIPEINETETPYFLVEDSNAGYEFFKAAAGGRAACVSAHGKSNIYRTIIEQKNRFCVVVADGAAFGPEMERVMELLRAGYRAALYLPESFEWLILSSGIIDDKETREMLSSPEDHIESSIYFSWERFFAAYLTERSEGTYYQYSKNTLNGAYLQPKEKSMILSAVPGEIRRFITQEG